MGDEYYVYALCDPRKNNEYFYIGKGKDILKKDGSIQPRWKVHLYETKNKSENIFKYNVIQAIRKIGLEPHHIKISENLTEQEAYDLEAKLIEQYGRRGIDQNGILTNRCIDNRPPSPKGRIVSDETKKKLSQANSGQTPWNKGKTDVYSDETLQKLRQSNLGSNNPMYGTTHEVSEETRKKIGDAQRGELNHRYGKEWDDDHKEKMRQWALENNIKPPIRDKPHTEETKKKMSETAKGKPKSEEHKNALSLARQGKIIDKKLNWNIVDEIRLMNRIGKTTSEINEKFPLLSKRCIRDIINNVRCKQEFHP